MVDVIVGLETCTRCCRNGSLLCGELDRGEAQIYLGGVDSSANIIGEIQSLNWSRSTT